MRKHLAVLAAAVLTLGACSSGSSSESDSGASTSPSTQTASDTPEEAQAKADIKKGLLQQGGGFEGAQLDEQQASCVADGLVDGLGVDKLRRYQLLTKDDRLRIQNPTDLDPADADTVSSTFVDCVDLGELVTAALGQAGQLGTQQKQCIEGALDEETLKKALSDSLQGRTPDFSGMQQDLAKCATAGQG